MNNTTINLIKDVASKTQALAEAMKALAEQIEKEEAPITIAELARNLTTLDLS